MYFLVQAKFLSYCGLNLKERVCSLGAQIFYLNVISNFYRATAAKSY